MKQRIWGILVLVISFTVHAQEETVKHYFGILPSVLAEPYDSLKALDINCAPFVLEIRSKHAIGIQFRPMINYRCYKPQAGIAHLGGTLFINKYLITVFGEKHPKLIPCIGLFFTGTYNRIDRVITLIMGMETGLNIAFSTRFSLTCSFQPGIDYFPNPHSRIIAGTSNGFKPHFGVILHAGYHF